ncbi:hypothetical protein V6N11_016535 [Hibiscus sabdariffa]|uniref:Auxin efflux carrier component n=1 Tax=Hibiscus sabdariffa TaxID=183260 RepID=A0ABR2TV94_9ROSI
MGPRDAVVDDSGAARFSDKFDWIGQSSRNPTPRGSSFNHTDFYGKNLSNVSPRESSFGNLGFDEENGVGVFGNNPGRTNGGAYPAPTSAGIFSPVAKKAANGGGGGDGAASIAVGLRGVLLRIAIVQAALPQGIVPFVFAKEYNVHPDILSTGVIFGMLIALPITLVYYILLGL